MYSVDQCFFYKMYMCCVWNCNRFVMPLKYKLFCFCVCSVSCMMLVCAYVPAHWYLCLVCVYVLFGLLGTEHRYGSNDMSLCSDAKINKKVTYDTRDKLANWLYTY